MQLAIDYSKTEETFSIARVETDARDWDAYVDSHPRATNYHRFGWKQVVEESFGHEGIYLIARDSSGDVCGVFPLVLMKSPIFGAFLVSVPFFNYGGLLCDSPDVETAFVVEAEKLRRKLGVDSVEMRHIEHNIPKMVTRSHKVTMILDLEGEEEQQWKAFNAKVRNQVRKAEKGGLETRLGHLDLLDGFYDVFCRNMRDLGTPVYGKNFFRNVLESFPGQTQILSVYLNGKIVASGILVWYRNTLEVPWASSIRDYREYCPNNLLYWEAIRFAIQRGMSKFDFGRSTPDEGTYRFKKQWGAKPVQLFWQYLVEEGGSLPELNPANPKLKLAIRIWQKLPVALTRILGPRIVRGIP